MKQISGWTVEEMEKLVEDDAESEAAIDQFRTAYYADIKRVIQKEPE